MMITINAYGVGEIMIFILTLVAITITLRVVLETGKRLRSCYRCILFALVVFGIIKFFDLLNELQIVIFGSWFHGFYSILGLLFVGLFIMGILNIQKAIKERQDNCKKNYRRRNYKRKGK